MRLPFVDNKKEFERLPGDRPICVGVFRKAALEELLASKESKVLGTAARFLQVPHTEIVQVIPISNLAVSVFFAEKQVDLYEYGDEDE